MKKVHIQVVGCMTKKDIDLVLLVVGKHHTHVEVYVRRMYVAPEHYIRILQRVRPSLDRGQ